MGRYARRRIVLVLLALVVVLGGLIASGTLKPSLPQTTNNLTSVESSPSLDVLDKIAIKGRAPKTDYSRAQFGDGWGTKNAVIDAKCDVTKGTLDDPYTGKQIAFTRGGSTSAAVQIDHVVALSDAWQTGAQQLTSVQRIALANDPLELLAVDGPANQQKSDGDAATWLPPNKPFRCQYVARQVAVKQKYSLWVTQAEHDAIQNILQTCPGQELPTK